MGGRRPDLTQKRSFVPVCGTAGQAYTAKREALVQVDPSRQVIPVGVPEPPIQTLLSITSDLVPE